MAYQALYRKWRPATFEEVKGQDHIVTTLKNQISGNRIGHAYLFSGTRGTGKTSVAKIFAKAVNCMHPVNGSPCNACEMCRAANEQRSMNMVEIDAASNNGVDNIREIREETAYSPAEGKYRVYIVDEVHMLSAGAFNALLKTLEEPPSYVIFILATTEIHKIPATILSRCQRYDFHRLSPLIIADRLRELCDAEGIEAEDEALAYVARMADGAMRDALSLFDQCIAFYAGELLTYEKTLNVLGAIDHAVFGEMLAMILEGRTGDMLGKVNDLVMLGRDLSQFVNDFVWYLRNLLLISAAPDAAGMVEVSAQQLEAMKALAEKTDSETLMRYIRILSELSGQIKSSSQKRVLIEVALIKLCKPAMEQNYEALVNRVRNLERQLEEGVFVAAQSVSEGAVRQEAPKPKKDPAELVKAMSEDVQGIIRRWPQIMSELTPLVSGMLRDSMVGEGPDSQLIVVPSDDMRLCFFQDPEHFKALEDAVSEVAGKAVTVIISAQNEKNERQKPTVDPLSYFENLGVPVETE